MDESELLARINAGLARQEAERRARYQAQLDFEAEAHAWLADLAAQGNRYAKLIVKELEDLQPEEDC